MLCLSWYLQNLDAGFWFFSEFLLARNLWHICEFGSNQRLKFKVHLCNFCNHQTNNLPLFQFLQPPKNNLPLFQFLWPPKKTISLSFILSWKMLRINVRPWWGVPHFQRKHLIEGDKLWESYHTSKKNLILVSMLRTGKRMVTQKALGGRGAIN